MAGLQKSADTTNTQLKSSIDIEEHAEVCQDCVVS